MKPSRSSGTRSDPRAAKVVWNSAYFGGYTDKKKLVDTLGVALSTVRRDWEFARSWLFDKIAVRSTRKACE